MRRVVVALVLAGCGGDGTAGGSPLGWPGTSPGATPGSAWGEQLECEGGDVEAPCCPQGLTLTEADCPPGHFVQTNVDAMGGGGQECYPREGEVHNVTRPYYVTDAEGRTRAYGVFADAVLCYPAAGHQKYRTRLAPSGASSFCVSDCYREDGSAAPCSDVEPQMAPCVN